MLLKLSASEWGCDELTSKKSSKSSGKRRRIFAKSFHLSWHFSVPFDSVSVPPTSRGGAWHLLQFATAASCWWRNMRLKWRERTHWSRRSCNASPGNAFRSSLETLLVQILYWVRVELSTQSLNSNPSSQVIDIEKLQINCWNEERNWDELQVGLGDGGWHWMFVQVQLRGQQRGSAQEI